MKTFVIVLIILGFLLQGLFIVAEHAEKYLVADVLKGAASLMFVLVGYNAFLSINNSFNK